MLPSLVYSLHLLPLDWCLWEMKPISRGIEMLRIGINRVLDVSYSVAMQCLLSQNYAAECVVCLE